MTTDHANSSGLIFSFVRRFPQIYAVGLLLFSSGCASQGRPHSVEAIQPQSFKAATSEVEHPGVINATRQAVGETSIRTSEKAIEEGGRTFVVQDEVVETDGMVDVREIRVETEVPVGESYTIDGLVGQINGRPIYADEFFLPIQDRILRMVAEYPRAQAMQQMDLLVTSRFREFVNSELIIAEAESGLSPEMQQGVFAWLRSTQEQTIAERGGTRATAEASIEEQFGMSLDDFLEQRRTVALAGDLLRKRVSPRSIVSWRDVEQAYLRRWSEFNPPAVMRIGRIRFNKNRQPEELEKARELIEQELSFADICKQMNVEDDGFWLEVTLPEDGIEGTTLVSAVKDRLKGLQSGQVSEVLEQRSFVSWFSVIEIVQPEGRSLYDPQVQIALEQQLSDLRYRQEQDRYLVSLRNRWITDDINKMRARLLDIARNRYLPY